MGLGRTALLLSASKDSSAALPPSLWILFASEPRQARIRERRVGGIGKTCDCNTYRERK